MSKTNNNLSTSVSNSRQQQLNELMTELAQCQAVLQLRKEKPPVILNTNATFKRFKKTYGRDPLAFGHDIFDWEDGKLTPYQEEILASIIEYERVALFGPRGFGKTCTGSIACWWGVLTADDTKVPTTASSWRQLDKYLWPEIHKWYQKIRWDKIGIPPLSRNRQLKSTEIELNKTAMAFAVASNDYNKIEGAHAKNRVLCIFDESKAVIEHTFDSMEGAHSMTEQPLALAMSTPGAKMGRFYDICTNKDNMYGDWHVIHVTMEDAIKAGRMSASWAEQRKKQWGQDSAIYRNHVLGEFAADSERTVIPINYVELAQSRWDYIMKEGSVGSVTAIGIDPARGGGDITAVATVAGNVVLDIITYDFDDTMRIVETVSPLIGSNPLARVVVDVIGVGAGVYDRLHQLFGDRILPFSSSEKTDTRDRSGQLRFRNKRAWSWWAMREALDPSYGSTIALPPDDELTGELTTPRYEDKLGVMQVESKDDIRSALSRSTNKADAVINALVGANLCIANTTEVLSYLDYIQEYGVEYA